MGGICYLVDGEGGKYVVFSVTMRQSRQSGRSLAMERLLMFKIGNLVRLSTRLTRYEAWICLVKTSQCEGVVNQVVQISRSLEQEMRQGGRDKVGLGRDWKGNWGEVELSLAYM